MSSIVESPFIHAGGVRIATVLDDGLVVYVPYVHKGYSENEYAVGIEWIYLLNI